MLDINLGKIGYEAYCMFSGGKSLITGATLPPFSETPEPVQKAWHFSAKKIIEEYQLLIKK